MEDLVLTGLQLEEFAGALISAFPRREMLSRMLRYRLEIDLDTEVKNGVSHNETVDELLVWAKACGRLRELAEKSIAFQKGSRDLGLFCSKYVFLEQNLIPDGEPGDGCRPINADFTWCHWAVHRAASCVCRIEMHRSLATGFLVGTDLVLTCGYCLTGRDNSQPTWFRFFDYYQTNGITERLVKGVVGDPVASCSPEGLDYALLRLSEPVGHDPVGNGETTRGWLRLAQKAPGQNDSTIQLHYPNGDLLQSATVQIKGSRVRIVFVIGMRHRPAAVVRHA